MKLGELKELFILLIQYYKEFKESSTGLIEPKEIIEATNNERKKIILLNNLLMIELYIVLISLINLILLKFNVFRNYMTDSGHNPTHLNELTFNKNLILNMLILLRKF